MRASVRGGEEERENWLRATVLLSDKPEPVKAVPNEALLDKVTLRDDVSFLKKNANLKHF